MVNILSKLADACKMQDPVSTEVIPDRPSNANCPQTAEVIKGRRFPINHIGKQASADLLFKIADVINSEVHKEKEKRIDLKSLPKECSGIKPSIIKQGVLREVKDGDDIVSYCRIRMKQDPGKSPKYTLGVKNFSKSEESEVEISKDTFDSFYPDNLDKPQSKKRFELDSGWEIDQKDDGSIVAEFEYKNKNEIEIPESFDLKEGDQEKTSSFENELMKLSKISKFKALKKNEVPLTPEEHAEVMKRKATWNYSTESGPSSAVWKSVDKKTGKTTYITHTHRAYNTASTLKGAIGRYHSFIKGTA